MLHFIFFINQPKLLSVRHLPRLEAVFKLYYDVRSSKMATTTSIVTTVAESQDQHENEGGGSQTDEIVLEASCHRLRDTSIDELSGPPKGSRTQSTRQLTFGMEWEFMIPQGTSETESHPEDARFYVKHVERARFRREWAVFNFIESILQDAVPICVEDENLVRMAGEKKLTLARGRPKCAYFWALDIDYSLRPCAEDDVRGDYEFLPQHCLELRSRILTAEGFDEVALVYKLLRRHLRINLNRTCSFHCHVGTGHLDLTGYKKLVTLVLICEPFLYRCCAPYRRESQYCRSIALWSRFARQKIPVLTRDDKRLVELVSPDIPSRLLGILIYVWRSSSLADLREGLMVPIEGKSSPWRGGFAIRGEQEAKDCWDEETTPDSTVEFRYSHASGDPARDTAWIKICMALVRAADFDNNQFKITLDFIQRGKHFASFLSPLGLGDDCAFWSQVERDLGRELEVPESPPKGFLSALD